MQDKQLIRKLHSGDESAFKYFFEKYYPPLYNYIFYRVSRNHSITEEIVGDSFLSALRAVPRLDREKSNLYIWLTTIARNKLTDYYRKQRPTVSLDDCLKSADQQIINLFKDFSDDNPISEEALRREEVKHFVNAAMTSLPHKYRESLRQKYMEDKSIQEIADVLNTSCKAVESLLYRSRLAFKQAFEILLKERMHPSMNTGNESQGS